MTPKARERIATILVEAVVKGDKAAAETYGCTVRSIQRYRLKLAADVELSRLVAAKKATVEAGWAAELPGAMRASIEFLRKAAESLDPMKPGAVAVISEALERMSEVAATWRLLDGRIGKGSAKPELAAVVPLTAPTKKQA